MLLKHVADALVASRDWDSASLSRVGFWVESLGHREFTSVTIDDVDAALVRLAERGRLQSGRRPTARSDKPLKGATINRYVSTLGSLYRFAKRARLVSRTFIAPSRGIEKLPEPADPDRYLRRDEVERILTSARVIDRRWKRLPALIVIALHTGLRKGSLQKLRWENVDLGARRLVLGRTKNGDPIGSALTERCVVELERLSGKDPASLVFGNRHGKPFHFKHLWEHACEMASLPGRNFHQLRHGCGSALASSSPSSSTNAPTCRSVEPDLSGTGKSPDNARVEKLQRLTAPAVPGTQIGSCRSTTCGPRSRTGGRSRREPPPTPH